MSVTARVAVNFVPPNVLRTGKTITNVIRLRTNPKIDFHSIAFKASTLPNGFMERSRRPRRATISVAVGSTFVCWGQWGYLDIDDFTRQRYRIAKCVACKEPVGRNRTRCESSHEDQTSADRRGMGTSAVLT